MGIRICPQPGFQVKVMSSSADILICGGSSGPGKTWLLLAEPLRHYAVKGFNATIFRRTSPQITAPGGMWDKSMDLYSHFGGHPVRSTTEWRFPSSRFIFQHMQNSEDWINVQGSERCYIGYDELCQFESDQFFKVLAWNRSTCGVKPYIRATCNPDPDSWVAGFIDWWIGDDGYPILERDGVIRYFITVDGKQVWGDSREEVYEKCRHVLDANETKDKLSLIKSFTFIKGTVYENRELLDNDPGYVSNLLALNEEEQMRFLHGNWKVKLHHDILMNYSDFMNIFTNDFVVGRNKREGFKKYITADIATTGRDLFVIAYWEGNHLVDLEMKEKNSGKEAIDAIEAMKVKYEVSNNSICFDADGVGNGLTGWIKGCVEFHSNKVAIGKNNYRNIKAQCAFEVSYCVNQTAPKSSKDAYYVSPYVAEMRFPFDSPTIYKGKTIGWIMQHQMKAIRKAKGESDMKLGIEKKEAQKLYLGGISPDIIEQFFFRKYFDIKNFEPIKVKVY